MAIAGSAASLTGLLFVAISVAPHRARSGTPAVIHQIRAAAAMVAFMNALAVSLFSLVPGTHVGIPAVVLGIGGIFFTAASLRSLLSSPEVRPEHRRPQLGLICLLLLIFGVEVVCGIVVRSGSSRGTAIDLISYALVASLILGVGRAWELVGDRDTGLLASLTVLVGREPHPPDPNAATATAAPAAEAGPAPDPDPGPTRDGPRGE